MTKIRKEIIVNNKLGLHARPAALFVQAANKFDARIAVIKDKEKVNGKSIMGILMLGVEQGSTIIIEVEGHDANAAIWELERIMKSDESESTA